ncbi:G-patch domain-containing protein [Mycena kentingensis (nom. inval.)]|nr:G-patch domain-containing protein [Mycena kentingensis (nom. inval.)]
MACRRSLSTIPWFVDAADVAYTRNLPPHIRPNRAPPLPADAPQALKNLHAQLVLSPLLEPTSLLVTRPQALPSGPALPHKEPRGRRRRGGTYAGESAFDISGNLWSWIALAQVKEGTENKGGIESIVRIVRKTLLTSTPPLALPPNTKKRAHNGWAMIDAGSFAVHVLSKQAMDRYFAPNRFLPWGNE